MANDEILVGYAKVWYAPIGEATPDPNTIGYGAAWGGNWGYLGDTLDPLTLTYEIEDFAVEIEQSLAPVKSSRVKQAPMLKSTLSDHTLSTLQMLLGGTITPTAAGAGQVGMDSLAYGGETKVNYYKWGFEVLYSDPNGADLPVRYFYHRGSLMPGGDIVFGKRNAAGIPFEIKILDDTSQGVGAQTGIIEYVTAPAAA